MAFSRSACGTCLFERALFLDDNLGYLSWTGLCAAAWCQIWSRERMVSYKLCWRQTATGWNWAHRTTILRRYSVAFNRSVVFEMTSITTIIRSDGIFYFHQITPFSLASSCIVISMREYFVIHQCLVWSRQFTSSATSIQFANKNSANPKMLRQT